MSAPATVPVSSLSAEQRRHVAALAALFEHIQHARMAGIPMLHPGLQVAAVGFRPEGDAGALAGVLVSPWFMNLVWLPPPAAQAAAQSSVDVVLRVGERRARSVGSQTFDFIGAHEEGFGSFEACSLFSPMFEFADQAAAESTAQAVMALLDESASQPVAPSSPQAAAAAHPPAANRRGFLLGRSSV